MSFLEKFIVMDVPREVDTGLENLNQNILRGGTDDFFSGSSKEVFRNLVSDQRVTRCRWKHASTRWVRTSTSS